MSLTPVRDTFLSHVTLLWNDGSTDADKSFQVTADTTVWVQVSRRFWQYMFRHYSFEFGQQ
jgi:hypothetical protein